MKLFQPKYLPLSKDSIQQYKYETISFLEKVAADLFKTASNMVNALDQHDLLDLNRKILHGTISDDEIRKVNGILRRNGYCNWIFGQKQ